MIVALCFSCDKTLIPNNADAVLLPKCSVHVCGANSQKDCTAFAAVKPA